MNAFLDYCHVENRITVRPGRWLHLYHVLYDRGQVIAEDTWNLRINAFENFLVKSLHVFCPEWRLKSNCFIQYAAKRPDIRLVVVGLISPHFRRCVVWSSGLSVEQAFLCNFADVHVSEFCSSIFREEDVCTFQITMKN